MRTLSVGDCIRFAWETFKRRPWILIGAFLLAIIISNIPNLLGTEPEFTPEGEIILQMPGALDVVAFILSVVVAVLVWTGLITFFLRAHDNVEGVQLADLWNPAPFWRFLGAHILTGIVVALGFLAFVVPGIILALGLAFVPYLVVERGLGPIEAMKESWRVTKGYKGQMGLLLLALIGIIILGLLALGIGVFVAAPIAMLAMTHAYRVLAT
ncbi:MAG TPA: DUF975 family protein [Hyphomicrobium sp.]|nr:DUF975 family protein [Hyphomicrobium sp.]